LYSDCYDDRAPAPRDEAFPAAQTPAEQLVRPCDIKGILHSHSRWADGAHSLSSMVATAQEIGLEYLGISDHFRSVAHPEAWTCRRRRCSGRRSSACGR